MWEPLLSSLRSLPLIMPDSRGHGRSTNPSGRLGADDAGIPNLTHVDAHLGNSQLS